VTNLVVDFLLGQGVLIVPERTLTFSPNDNLVRPQVV
jgi:hypothetical protein